eukprot:gene32473-40077_t
MLAVSFLQSRTQHVNIGIAAVYAHPLEDFTNTVATIA